MGRCGLLLALGAFTCLPLGAQGAGGAGNAFLRRVAPLAVVYAPRTVPSRSVASAPWRGSGDSARAPVVASTKGTEVTVIRVPVPSTVRWEAVMSNRPAQFRFVPGRHVQVLGPLTGRLDMTKDTALVLALRVSRRAPAGRSLGGTVEFAIGTLASVVPVELDVPVSRRLVLTMTSRSMLATRGRWSTAVLRIQNDGNVDDDATVRADVPHGWRADVRAAHAGRRVAAGTSTDLTLRVWVPAQYSSGLSMIPVTLARHEGRDTTVQLQVDVIGDLAGQHSGAQVTTPFITGRMAGEESATGYALALGGQLSDSMRVSGRLTYSGPPRSGHLGDLMLARSGMLSGPPTLELHHPTLQVQAGATSSPMPELAGQILAGIGGVVGIQRNGWSLRGFELRPMALGLRSSMLATGVGVMQGGELGYARRVIRTSVFAAQLDDAFTRRALHTYGMRVGLGVDGGARFQSEVAYREVGQRRGIGVATSFQRTGRSSFLELRAMHAPGGSQGFARASDELSVAASRSFGQRAYVAVGGWLQEDQNAQLGAVMNRGWTLAPALNIPRLGTVGLDLRGLQFGTTVNGTHLSNDEVAAGTLVTTSVFGTLLTARSTLSRIDRRLMDSLISTTSRQLRLDHSISALRGSSRGLLQANWSYQQFSGMSGSMPAQQSLQLRLERLRPRLNAPIFFEADMQRMQMGTRGPTYWTARAAATLDLPIGMAVTIAAERNPFIMALHSNGQQPLVYTMRVDRTASLPRLFTGARSRVFRDDNGNGRMDRSERGVAGVVIRCGARQVQTDGQGRYSCGEREQHVDARTVPTGLMTSSSTVQYGKPVPLRVMQPLRVALRLTSADSSRVPASALAAAVVYARDSSGGQWYARPTSQGTFVLDALPVGEYTIGVDASGLEEPLSMAGADPVVRIGGAGQPDDVVIDLKARPLRIKSFSPGAGGPSLRLNDKSVPTRRLRPAPKRSSKTLPASNRR